MGQQGIYVAPCSVKPNRDRTDIVESACKEQRLWVIEFEIGKIVYFFKLFQNLQEQGVTPNSHLRLKAWLLAIIQFFRCITIRYTYFFIEKASVLFNNTNKIRLI